MIVHEAAHFAYSPPYLVTWADYIEKRTSRYFNGAIARVIGNIIEDIFIEAEIDRRVPSITWMLDASNGIIFDDKDVAERIEAAEEFQQAPTSLKGVASVLDALILAKTRSSIAIKSDYVNSLFELARTATEPLTLDDRLEVALSVYDAVMANLIPSMDMCSKPSKKGEKGDGKGTDATGTGSPEGEESEGEGEAGSGEDKAPGRSSMLEEPEVGEDKASVEPSKSDIKRLEELEKKSEGLGATHGAKKTSDKLPSGMPAAVNQQVKMLEGNKITLVPSDEKGMLRNPTSLFIEKPLGMDEGGMELDKRYSRLAEIGRQRATVNRPYGVDRERGHNIRKLYRIGTDQKIFAETLKMSNYKPMQVLILIDCSGSMSGQRVNQAMKAALGAAHGLVEARCEVAVYGHTADTMGGTEVIIYRGKTFTEPITLLGPRLKHLLRNERLCQNRDGYAIGYVAKKMTNTQRKRLMIVISDGEPCAPGYSGTAGDDHTRRTVEETRRKGIQILSISISPEANRANNRIYGEDWNVFNEDPGVIDHIVRTMVLGK
jgi:cobalamin biosynthesis protein CobT